MAQTTPRFFFTFQIVLRQSQILLGIFHFLPRGLTGKHLLPRKVQPNFLIFCFLRHIGSQTFSLLDHKRIIVKVQRLIRNGADVALPRDSRKVRQIKGCQFRRR